ncbi:hypothetical protein V6N11_055478 [Hibiscus sabdariffa]|uniref:Uncharacterized protein n=1 Tax=Hibiscus sabdariffa TaxID=183260 RepID=A0ABR2PFX6_9ROSI
MKKLLFFKSSSSSGNGSTVVPSPSADKQVFWENMLESGFNDQLGDKAEYSFLSPKLFFGKSRKQIPDSPSFSNSPAGLQRSRSLSSAGFLVDGLGQEVFPSSNDQNRSPNITPNHQYDQSSRRKTLTPKKSLRLNDVKWQLIVLRGPFLVLQGYAMIHLEALPLARAMCQVKLWTVILMENSCWKAVSP